MKSFKVRGHIRDLIAFARLGKQRLKRFESAPISPDQPDMIRQLALQLHPSRLFLVIDNIVEETDDTRTYFLKLDTNQRVNPPELPLFRAGQFLVLKVPVGESMVSRPYSISSKPEDAVDQHVYAITVAVEGEGIASNEIVGNWQVGQTVESSGPMGFFHFDAIRDTNDVVALAGGTGITPIRSIVEDLLDSDSTARVHLLYGARDESRILFKENWEELAVKTERFSYTPVYSESNGGDKGRKGFITADLIRECVGPDLDGKTFFVCGPPPMYRFLEEQFDDMKIPGFRIRTEVFGPGHSVESIPGFPLERADQPVTITVRNGVDELQIPGQVGESIAVSMEKANVPAPTKCRSGSCGYCRSLLLNGDVFVNPITDRRRKGDQLYGFFHPCSSYPLTDVTVEYPRDK